MNITPYVPGSSGVTPMPLAERDTEGASSVPDVVNDPLESASGLRDWLRDLKEASGLSFAAIGQAIGEEERNVKRWMTVTGRPVVPGGDVLLRLLTALGVRFEPAPPEPLRALTAQIAELREMVASIDGWIEELGEAEGGELDQMSTAVRLRALEEKLDEASQAAAENALRLAAAIEALSARLPAEAQPGPRSAKKR